MRTDRRRWMALHYIAWGGQIADELAAKLPDMFQDHQLHQAWAYKYSKARIGINVGGATCVRANIATPRYVVLTLVLVVPIGFTGLAQVHADQAALNVNCWCDGRTTLADARHAHGRHVWREAS